MPKAIAQIRNARIIPAVSLWPERAEQFKPDDMVMLGELASVHPVLGAPVVGVEGANKIRTSLIVEQRLSAREVETMNTIYQLVD
ncbi:hypothetical protein D3C84_105120 [compost metagenome]